MDFWHHLGLENQRVLLVHHDDLGIHRDQNQAFWKLGFPTGSVMVTAAWAEELKGMDLGVHLTLTSEKNAPRLRSLTGGSSLCDREGFFWSTLKEAWRHIQPKEAEAELRAQIETAANMGLDITHLDNHMGVLTYPCLAEIYHRLAMEYQLPIPLPQNLDDFFPAQSMFFETLAAIRDASPLPKVRVVDGYSVPPNERRDWYLKTLSKMGPGVYHLTHHAALHTPESPVFIDWKGRQADWEALQDPEIRQVMAGFVSLTYREIRDVLRNDFLKKGTQCPKK